MVLAPHAGDVVVAYSPQNPCHVVCKRVLGLPGDEVPVARTSRSAPRTEKVHLLGSLSHLQSVLF